jgi:RNA polymerase-binding protein DksA
MEATELEPYRTALEKMREELRQQLIDLGASPDEDALESGVFDPGFADSAQSTAERGKVIALTVRLRDQLAEAERALKKVAAGTYGLCERCGQPIGQERLEAIPYATLCVSCKQKESA